MLGITKQKHLRRDLYLQQLNALTNVLRPVLLVVENWVQFQAVHVSDFWPKARSSPCSPDSSDNASGEGGVPTPGRNSPPDLLTSAFRWASRPHF